MKRRALILGVTGQDGSHTAEMLLQRGYEVHGLHRRTSAGNLANIKHLLDRITLHRGDLADVLSIDRAVAESDPQEIYNQADQDSVDWSFHLGDYAVDVTAGSAGRLLEIVRRRNPGIRVYQAISAMIFGDSPPPQGLQTPLRPMSPYACAKAHALYLCRYYREVHGLFVACGILFHHASIRRSRDYLLHQFASSAVAVAQGKKKTFAIGNPMQELDICHAEDVVDCAVRMLDYHTPGDWIVGRGATLSLHAIALGMLRHAGLTTIPDPVRQGDSRHVRPGPPSRLIADAAETRELLGWRPAWTTEAILGAFVKDALRQEESCRD